MLLNRLKIKNFCQHRAFETDFDPGLNLILGPNGSGKSNLLEAIQFAIIGELTKHTREQVVCHHAGEKDECLVSLDFQHYDFNVEITRSIRPSLHNLYCYMRSDKYNTSIEGFAEVNSYVLELLDMQKKQLQDYVFIAQGGLDTLINKTKEQRTIELAKIFGVAETEKIWEALGNRLTKVEVPTVPDLPALEYKISQLKIECMQIDEQVNQLTAQLLTKEQQTEVWDIINARKDYNKLLKAWNTGRIQEDELADELARLPDWAEQEQQLRQVGEDITEAEYQAKEADEILAEWRHYKNNEKSRERMKDVLNKIIEAIKTRPAVLPRYKQVLTTARDSFHDIKEDLTKVSLEILTAENSIKSAVCTTCRRPFDNYDDIEKELELLREDQRRIKSIYELFNEILTIAEGRARIRKQIQDWRDDAEKLDVLSPPAITEIDCHQRHTRLARLRKQFAGLNDEINKLKVKYARVQGNYENTQKQVVDYENKLLNANVVNSREFNTILTCLIDDDTRKDELTQLLNQQTRKQVELEQAEKALADGLGLLGRRKTVLAGRDYLTGLRDLFHRGNLAKRIIETYLESICTDVNDMLSIFDAPFRVACGEQLNFDAVFSGNKRIPDKLLSGGQRVMLSLAFRTALNARFAASMGLLSLDEPTVFLDKHTKQCLPEVLEKLRILCREKQLQLLFVTHETEFMDHFDKVIELERV